MRFFSVAASCLLPLVAGLPARRANTPALEERKCLDDSQLAYYPAPVPNGSGIGVLVIPGGGYQMVSLDWEGVQTTTYLNEKGFDAWVLNYSVADTAPTPLYPVPMNEALDAVRQIRAQKKELTKLGIWGYSAGGHLAAMTVTNPEAELDFGILAYPVITMDPEYTHPGSRENLIGDDASPELQEKTSAEKTVTESTPPIFLFHTANDASVPVENALLFSNAMSAHKRPFQSLILPDGEHGIALGIGDPKLDWTVELERWMQYSI